MRDQVSAYLATTGGRFGPRDKVFVWAGANDVLRPAFFPPIASDAEGEALVRQAAKDLVGEVRRMAAAGAGQVVVLNLDDYGDTPGPRLNPRKAVVSTWVRAFNDELASGLAGQPVLIVDTYSLLHAARKARDRRSCAGADQGGGQSLI